MSPGFGRLFNQFVKVFVIIAAIGILLSMIIPSTLRMHYPAYRTVCMNNLRKIGQACVMYSQDFGGYYPTVRGPGSDSRPLASLALLYDQYVSSNRVFSCPSSKDSCNDLRPGQSFLPHTQAGTATDGRHCAYAYDDTRGPNTSPDIVIAGHAFPLRNLHYEKKPRDGLFGCNRSKVGDHGQWVLMYGGNTVLWITTTINPNIPGDDIYSAANPTNPGASDSYIHQ